MSMPSKDWQQPPDANQVIKYIKKIVKANLMKWIKYDSQTHFGGYV